ncbi:hypothetical protein DESUT3_05220 [Desulfuromonas versatilis]|uniref:Lipoprotein n=1 Tax=Desulfuromonas versatilis TaxID=2802975 RepID=A0ABN6DTH8_9BACT|nr:hypothetical protein [Desulfuromonas versatilis]BCR03453.1 hypothetical protein DESUT3_05220 [Desulfuromonas versatilis]
MRMLAILIGLSAMLAGCATLEEAYWVDREFGQASQSSWDKMVAYPDYRYAGQVPEGTEGISAEEIMDVNNQTFAEKIEKTDIFQFGIKAD